jgi:aconitate hydratase
MPDLDSFGSRSQLALGDRTVRIARLDALTKAGVGNVDRLPFSLKILLENLLRNEDGLTVTRDDIAALAAWDPNGEERREIAYRPARVLMQDFTGVPAIVDLATMRDAIADWGGDPKRINPLVPADLVIDHSVQVDSAGGPGAFAYNARRELERNKERYALLRWGQQAFSNSRVVPPDTGIVHQVNLEYLGRVVFESQVDGETVAYPDTLVGTDSHTTMINGLGVIGWGVGGIEAEAVMLGQPMSMLVPEVIGFRLSGRLHEGATATDLVLTVTEMLRRRGVVEKFVEFYGPGLTNLPLPDRATIANMAPEYGATVGFFPVDNETLNYLRFTGRDEGLVRLVETYCKEQGLFRSDSAPEPVFTDTLSLDLADVVPGIAGPRRPQDRVPLTSAKESWRAGLAQLRGEQRLLEPHAVESVEGGFELKDGAVVIAAITSCTNTSNPQVLVAAGLLARNAAQKGLKPPPWVKTSLAPGSKVVTAYLDEAGLTPYLDELGFYLVGYGCTTCIGNSGPLDDTVANAIEEGDLVAAAVLSGNRNFEGRIHSQVRANYLASPPLVVAYALAGHMDIDFETEPIGKDEAGADVFLRDIWPSQIEVEEALRTSLRASMFSQKYGEVFEGDDEWRNLDVPRGDRFDWDDSSTYVRKPPYFEGMTLEPVPPGDIRHARVLAVLGDSVTTDHISPAGEILEDGPAGRYLIRQEVDPRDFNSFGARRGNHEVMMRGTFGNNRLRNRLAAGKEGPWTRHQPSGDEMFIYDAAMRYKAEGVPLVVFAGKEYGSGSSRDWAAKGPMLLGVRAVIAQSFERIHRSNLVFMGVLPLVFDAGTDVESLGLTGEEEIEIDDIAAGLTPGQRLEVKATSPAGVVKTFPVICRIDTPVEVEYYRHGGILPYVLRQIAKS